MCTHRTRGAALGRDIHTRAHAQDSLWNNFAELNNSTTGSLQNSFGQGYGYEYRSSLPGGWRAARAEVVQGEAVVLPRAAAELLACLFFLLNLLLLVSRPLRTCELLICFKCVLKQNVHLACMRCSFIRKVCFA